MSRTSSRREFMIKMASGDSCADRAILSTHAQYSGSDSPVALH